MDVEIPCEQCGVALRVPYEASGHRARCPGCAHEFVVPKLDRLVEDTVSEWIEHDVEEILENRDHEIEAQIRKSVDSQRRLAERDAERRNGHDHRPAEPPPVVTRSAGQVWPTRVRQPAGAPRPDPGADPDIELIEDKPRASRHHAHDSTESSHVPEYTQSGRGSSADSIHGHTHHDHKHRYPTNLHQEGRVPHLVVLGVNAAGVRLAFDSAWLNHEGFRASMPVRCAFSGAAAREKLVARPLAFTDRALSAPPSVDAINHAHECRELGDKSPRQLMAMMGCLEGIQQPFANAMPYYVSTRFAHLPLHCATRDRLSGNVTCEVIIPDAPTALEWVGRVNGVWGKEYHLLEEDVQLLHGDAWKQLSEDARQRIGVWCKLGPKESLRHFFADADFGKRDEGLAGLVLTDRRLVFCKYHHKGQIALDTPEAAILARHEGKFANLALRVGSDLHRMVKIHASDLDRLGDALREHGRIELHTSVD